MLWRGTSSDNWKVFVSLLVNTSNPNTQGNSLSGFSSRKNIGLRWTLSVSLSSWSIEQNIGKSNLKGLYLKYTWGRYPRHLPRIGLKSQIAFLWMAKREERKQIDSFFCSVANNFRQCFLIGWNRQGERWTIRVTQIQQTTQPTDIKLGVFLKILRQKYPRGSKENSWNFFWRNGNESWQKILKGRKRWVNNWELWEERRAVGIRFFWQRLSSQ